MDNQNANPKQALLERLGSSTNILVTVSIDPSVDQLAACLGLTLWLNKIGKHATAVFSGTIPSTLEFLQPEATLEKNTDSLRDFIISLDKSKADKLRYKVEDTVVKVFVTPYRTSLSASDLEFSQGDFNVDMVIALGVTSQQDLDTAITAHGRILHDAAVATVTTSNSSELGSINWHDSQASSLSELIADLGNGLDRTQLDGQIATALLTGIVAETARFSNEKTTPQTMTMSSELMSAGANQQLVASKLEEPAPKPVASVEPEQANEQPTPAAEDEPVEEAPKSNDGTIEISHDGELKQVAVPEPEQPAEEPAPEPQPEAVPEPVFEETPQSPDDNFQSDARNSRMITEPPSLGGTLTANSRPDDIMLEAPSDPLSNAANAAPRPLLGRQNQPAEAETGAAVEPEAQLQPAPADWTPPQPVFESNDTLAEIEQAVDSPHLEEPSIDTARDEVLRAINAVPDNNLQPVQALNAQPIELEQLPPAPAPATAFEPDASEVATPVEQPFTLPLPPAAAPFAPEAGQPTAAPGDPNAPPPVPPPLMPPGFPPAQ